VWVRFVGQTEWHRLMKGHGVTVGGRGATRRAGADDVRGTPTQLLRLDPSGCRGDRPGASRRSASC